MPYCTQAIKHRATLRTYSAVLVAVLLSAVSPIHAEAEFSDENVQSAINKAAAYLLSQQKDDGSWGDATGGLDIKDNDRKIGLAGLVTYALLANGHSINEPQIKQALDYMEQESDWTYALALRSQAWLEASYQNPSYRRHISHDARKLIRMAADRAKKPVGSYEYRAGAGRSGDPSNSQYGLLGVWAGANRGVEIPRQYWKAAMQYWISTQQKDGGWSYKGPKEAPSGSMTSAGVASLFVCVDALYAARFVRCGQNPEIPAIRKGLDWFEANFEKSMTNHGIAHQGHGDMYYYLFGVERIGLASGYKYFGKQDWYRTGATLLLKNQNADGSWKSKFGSIAPTAYSLLFLIRGQQPIVVNRLAYDGDWNNRPRALACFSRWARSHFERHVNWQIVNLQTPPEEWHDAPLLLMTGERAPTLSDADIEKIRTYVHQGGTLMTMTECDGQAFSDGIRDAYTRLFPQYELLAVPEDHPLYDIQVDLHGSPKLFMIHNGVRPLAIHTDEDLAKAWQLNRHRTLRRDFDAMANILLYITGRKLHNRGVTLWPSEADMSAAAPAARIVRVQYPGNWNPEPLALERFRRLAAKDDNLCFALDGTVDLADLQSSNANLAVMTGTGGIMLSAEHLEAIKAFTGRGGTLLIDAAASSPAFYDAVYKTLTREFHDLLQLPMDSPIYTLPQCPIEKIGLRGSISGSTRATRPRLEGITVNGRVAIILSRDDLTAALLGLRVVDCKGYVPTSAYDLMRNIALYSSR